jgi:dihydrofolate reductase
MRDVYAGLFISLDGVVESPNLWQFDSFDDDLAAAMSSYIDSVDTILLGRKTYEEWAGYWPTSTDEPYASHINLTPKHVASTTLDRVGWGQYDTATLIEGGLADEITRLKQLPGRTISTAGSPTLVRSLLQHNLLDVLTLMVHPVVVGKGQRLFQEGDDLKRLQLVESRVTSSGVAVLTYHPRQDR